MRRFELSEIAGKKMLLIQEYWDLAGSSTICLTEAKVAVL